MKALTTLLILLFSFQTFAEDWVPSYSAFMYSARNRIQNKGFVVLASQDARIYFDLVEYGNTGEGCTKEKCVFNFSMHDLLTGEVVNFPLNLSLKNIKSLISINNPSDEKWNKIITELDKEPGKVYTGRYQALANNAQFSPQAVQLFQNQINKILGGFVAKVTPDSAYIVKDMAKIQYDLKTKGLSVDINPIGRGLNTYITDFRFLDDCKIQVSATSRSRNDDNTYFEYERTTFEIDLEKVNFGYETIFIEREMNHTIIPTVFAMNQTDSESIKVTMKKTREFDQGNIEVLNAFDGSVAAAKMESLVNPASLHFMIRTSNACKGWK